jgi:chromosome segregation ATPase
MNKKAKDDYEDLQNKFKAKSDEMDTLNKELTTLKDSLNAFEKKKKEDDEEVDKKNKAEAKNKAEVELTNAVAVGKIKNETAILDTWRNLFDKDFDGTKKLIDAMNANKTAPVTKLGGTEKVYNAATINYEMNKKNQK